MNILLLLSLLQYVTRRLQMNLLGIWYLFSPRSPGQLVKPVMHAERRGRTRLRPVPKRGVPYQRARPSLTYDDNFQRT